MVYVLVSLLALWVYWGYSRICFVRMVIYGDHQVTLGTAYSTAKRLPELVLGLRSTQSGRLCDWLLRGMAFSVLWIMLYVNLDLIGRPLSGAFYRDVIWGVAYAFSILTVAITLASLWDLHANSYIRYLQIASTPGSHDDVLDSVAGLVVKVGWFALVVAANYVYQPTDGLLQLWYGVSVVWFVLFLLKICSVAYGRAKRWKIQSSS